MNIEPSVTTQLFKKASENNNWKKALVSGKHGQIVLMSISSKTNPANEIGMETHKFDQIILIAHGNAQVELNDKKMNVQTGDMIFIPQGTRHNVINLNKTSALKVISFYSNNDIPGNAVYKQKKDETKE
jgi:quercetin dioxygenase-like cupin family protein